MPELVEQIDEQTANVAAIQVLVCHNHDRPVAQVCGVCVLLATGESNDLLELRNLLGLLYLGVGGVLHVQHLALERVDAEQLALLLAEARESHRLG